MSSQKWNFQSKSSSIHCQLTRIVITCLTRLGSWPAGDCMFLAKLTFLCCLAVIKTVTDEGALITTEGSTGKVTHDVVNCLVCWVDTHVVRSLRKINCKWINTNQTLKLLCIKPKFEVFNTSLRRLHKYKENIVNFCLISGTILFCFFTTLSSFMSSFRDQTVYKTACVSCCKDGGELFRVKIHLAAEENWQFTKRFAIWKFDDISINITILSK